MHKSFLFSLFNFSTIEQSCYAFSLFLFLFWFVFLAGGRCVLVWLGHKDRRVFDSSLYRVFVGDWLALALVLAICTMVAAMLGMLFVVDQSLLRFVCVEV